MVRITVHGGAGEIGGNKILVEDGPSRLMLDFGQRMGYEGQYFSEYLPPRSNSSLRDRLAIGALPWICGIYRGDLATPLNADLLAGATGRRSIRPGSRYLGVPGLETCEGYRAANGAPFLDGILLSHAHLDHTGDLSFIDFGVPIYTSAETRTMLSAIDDVGKIKVEATETTLAALALSGPKSTFPGSIAKDKATTKHEVQTASRAVNVLEPGVPTPIGAFRVTLIPVDHSLPGAASFVIETTSGYRVLYTGDVRFHGRAGPTTAEYAQSVGRIDTVLCEGTRIDSESVLTEVQVTDSIESEIHSTEGLVLIDFAWKDTTRFETVLEASRRCGRIFVINAKLAYILHRLGQTLPGDVRVFLPRKNTLTYSPADYTGAKHEYGYTLDGDWFEDATHYENGLTADDIRADPSRFVLMLGYYNFNSLFDLANDGGQLPGSRLIKAVCEPFSDDMELDEERLLNWLDRFGIACDEEPASAPCPSCGSVPSRRSIRRKHVSGHASGPELSELIRLVAPARVIPVHTEHPEMFQSRLAGAGIEVMVPEAGRPIDL